MEEKERRSLLFPERNIPNARNQHRAECFWNSKFRFMFREREREREREIRRRAAELTLRYSQPSRENQGESLSGVQDAPETRRISIGAGAASA